MWDELTYVVAPPDGCIVGAAHTCTISWTWPYRWDPAGGKVVKVVYSFFDSVVISWAPIKSIGWCTVWTVAPIGVMTLVECGILGVAARLDVELALPFGVDLSGLGYSFLDCAVEDNAITWGNLEVPREVFDTITRNRSETICECLYDPVSEILIQGSSKRKLTWETKRNPNKTKKMAEVRMVAKFEVSKMMLGVCLEK